MNPGTVAVPVSEFSPRVHTPGAALTENVPSEPYEQAAVYAEGTASHAT